MEAGAAPFVLSTRSRVDAGRALAVVAPLALLAVALAAAVPGLVVQDSWLTLVGGREVVAHGLPGFDHLTVLASGHRWVDQQWLAQLLFYGAARLGGVGLAFAVSALAALTAFGLAALTAQRRGASPVAILVFLGWAVVAAPWGLQMRAQVLALPLFALILWLLTRERDTRCPSLLVLPVLVLWANIHGSVVVGLAVVFIYALVALARGARARALALLVLAPASLFVSPYAARLPGYYRLMLLDPPFGRFVKEWQRTSPSPLTAAFFVLAIAAVILVLRRRHRVALLDFLVLGLTLAVALDAMRGLIWFSLAALALLPALATRRPGSVRFTGGVASWSTAVALATIVAAVLWVSARPASAYETRLPASAADVVRAHAGSARVLANDTTADWLLWKIPALRGRLAYDVRFELLTRPQIRRLLAWRRLAPGWQVALRGYGLVVDDPVHVARLVATGRWQRLYTSARVAIAERTKEIGK